LRDTGLSLERHAGGGLVGVPLGGRLAELTVLLVIEAISLYVSPGDLEAEPFNAEAFAIRWFAKRLGGPR
jgi:hypothetical protein